MFSCPRDLETSMRVATPEPAKMTRFSTVMLTACVALALTVACVSAHAHNPDRYNVPVDPACVNMTNPPKLISFHIHVLFIKENQGMVDAALKVQQEFVEAFNVPIGPQKNCSFEAGDPQPEQKTICAYPTIWIPDGPFPTPQYSFFIPANFYEVTVKWIMQHRRGLDILVHANSGCELQDHLDWSLWGGKPWELNPTAFHCDSPGCRLPGNTTN
eukprot:m.11969 g.11969  ORF g.11969 m.11969 type:complete len:215 (+) comp5788_c0_seq2:58-702(+)